MIRIPRLRFGLVWERWFRYPAIVAFLAAIITAQLQPAAADEQPAARRKIVLIAGTLDAGHPKGTHEYEQTVRLLKYYLDHSTSADQVQVEVHMGGWPEQPATLEDADTIVVVSNGSDRNEQDHPLLVDGRLDMIERQMNRGCGLILLHWSTFLPNKHADRALEWIGGYFDYESGSGPNKWYSKIQTHTTRPKAATPDHPINRGLTPFELREEYYYNIRFRPDDPRLVKVLTTPIPGEPDEQTVAWAVERAEGGRGFAFTGGHFFENWGLEPFRRMVLNAILWTAHVEVPADGVQPAQPPGEPAPESDNASPNDAAPIRAAIVTGHQYPGHPWRETTLALEDALRKDPRIKVESIPDIEFLAGDKVAEYDLLVFNYCNWMRPGLSDEAKANFVRYLKEGGGLVIIHFANGAFHFSLPDAGDSDWPEYRKICRRVWDHTPGKSGHDAYGPFTVDILPVDHPITRGMPAFETTDELYFRQQGDEPIEVLATARSKGTGHDEPMAFVYEYGKGRVFQTVLGHDAPALQSPGTAELVRRACAWVAGRAQRAVEREAAAPLPEADRPEFGRVLDARLGHAVVAGRAERGNVPGAEHPDSSPLNNPARPGGQDKSAAARPPPGDHFEGFRESDVADDRANRMDSGNFASGSIRGPGGVTMKGIAILLGDKREAAMCFDTELLKFSAGWSGGFIRYSPTRFGLIEQPEIAGDVQFTSPGIPGWSSLGPMAAR